MKLVAFRPRHGAGHVSTRTVGWPGFWPVTPLMVSALALVGIPLATLVAYSVMERGPLGLGVVPGLQFESYKRLVYNVGLDGTSQFNGSYLAAYWRSIWIAALTTGLCLIAAVPTALWVATQSTKKRSILLILITIPFWTNMLIRTYAWILILSDKGLLNGTLQTVGIIHDPVKLLYTPWAVVLGLTYVFLPFMILPIYASAEKLDMRLVEAAYDLGASRAQAMRRVVLPALTPGIAGGVAMVFVPALGAFVQPALLGGGRTLTIGILIQQQFGPSRNWPFGSAMVVGMLIALAVTFTIIRLVGKHSTKKVQLI